MTLHIVIAASSAADATTNTTTINNNFNLWFIANFKLVVDGCSNNNQNNCNKIINHTFLTTIVYP